MSASEPIEELHDRDLTDDRNENSVYNDRISNNLASVGEVFSFARSRKVRYTLAGACFFAMLSGMVLPAMAFGYARVFQDLVSPASETFMKSIRESVSMLMVLGVVAFGSMTAQAALQEIAAEEMMIEFQTSWFRAMLRQDMTYYDTTDAAGQASIIHINGAKFKNGVGRKLAESVQFTVTFFGSLAYAFWVSWKVSLAVLVVSPAIFLSIVFSIRINSSQTARSGATYAKAGSIVSNALSSVRTILALNAVEKMVNTFKQATAEGCNGASKQAWLLGLSNGLHMGTFLLSYILVTTFGSWLIYDAVEEHGCDPSGTVIDNEACDPSGASVLGSLLGIEFAATIMPLLFISLEAFQGARAACFPAIQVMKRSPPESLQQESLTTIAEKVKARFPRSPRAIDSSTDIGLTPGEVRGEIVFSGVSFAYPSRPTVNVLDGFSLNIPAGKKVALVGTSGTGKSTAVQLLERFYDPQIGEIKLDGVDLRELNVKWLRQQIGLVSQEPKLFGCSIRENIAAAVPDATQEEIELAAKLANAHDFIMSFPKGYDTNVGDAGGSLSGGQKQRIAIARALLKRPSILLLDEATSALDSESESTVQNALDDLMGQMKSMTTIVIAHRLSTIKKADVIAVLLDGKVCEIGSHDELLERRGEYYGLVEAQKVRADEEEVAHPPRISQQRILPDKNLESGDAEVNHSSIPEIRFIDVGFKYPSRPDVEIFTRLNLSVKHGETLALVGSSGCGKTSIFQLLECFYRPTSGRIEYRGVNMTDLNTRWLRDQIGWVGQEPVLFDTTITENIRYGCPDATNEQVEEAAKKANAHDFIMKFPDGYSTRVGQGSSLVSGGQKQRIAIARALLKRPKVLLLDEATSALDSESERVVQAALDELVKDQNQTCIIIAHRLSTIRNADRIAVIDKGRVQEIGTHKELMARPRSRYRRLQSIQNLDRSQPGGWDSYISNSVSSLRDMEEGRSFKLQRGVSSKDLGKVANESKQMQYISRARKLALHDMHFLVLGVIGAILAGFMFPAWGFLFASMVELLYWPVEPCTPLSDSLAEDFADCELYWSSEAKQMESKSFGISFGFLGIIVTFIVGSILLFWGFGMASERLHKRVRDTAFTNLLRQEVAWFDLQSPGLIASRLSEDAAILHSFTGEPIRTLVSNVSSVLVGVVVAFIYMWPLALLALAILPFMGFAAEIEMRLYLGEDENFDESDENAPGAIVIETLAFMRTVASLTMEQRKEEEYSKALQAKLHRSARSKLAKGCTAGLGQFIQLWGVAMLFWWGGYLFYKFPGQFSYRSYMIATFSFVFSLYGLSYAVQGAADRKKAKLAAARIFELIDRQSLIDPLSTNGKMSA